MTFKNLKFIQVILGISATIILGYNFYVANSLKFSSEGDAEEFISIGTSLSEFQKYGQSFTEIGLSDSFKKGQVEGTLMFSSHSTWRPPIWPFLIAGIFLIFGYNLTYVLIFKFLLHLLGTFLFYKTLKLLNFKRTSLAIGVFLYCVSPAWQLYSRTFLSEPITFFFLSFWIYLLLKFLLNKTSFWPQALIAGIFILCHPYYIFLPFIVWGILFIYKNIKFKTVILSAILCCGIVSLWIVRNFLTLNTSEIVLTTSSGVVMAKGWNEKVPSEHTNTKGDLADESLVLKDFIYDKSKNYDEVEKMKLYQEATKSFIKTHPQLILPIITKKLSSAFNPIPETPKPGVLEFGRMVFQILTLIAILYILFRDSNKIIRSLIFGLLVATVAITTVTYSGFRFRMPQAAIELLLILYAVQMFYRQKREIEQ